MKIPHVLSCGVYRMAQKYKQTCTFCGMTLSVAGRIHCTSYYSDGKLKFDMTEDHTLHLNHPGDVSEFEYGAGRENWVMIFEQGVIRYDPERPGFYINDPECGIVPLHTKLACSELEIPQLRNIFSTVAELKRSSLPADQMQADLLCASLLQRFLICHDAASGSKSPATAYRKAIDEDESWQFSLEELSTKCGYNHDYIRREFFALYGISPVKYRQQRRISRILSLFTYTDLTVKEVAFQVGLKNVTHLNLLLKKEFGKTPTEICRSYRHNG